jgi:hypothetical protein
MDTRAQLLSPDAFGILAAGPNCHMQLLAELGS